MSPEEACGERRWHLLEEIGGAFASGQLDDLVEGDAGGLALVSPQLSHRSCDRSDADTQSPSESSESERDVA